VSSSLQSDIHGLFYLRCKADAHRTASSFCLQIVSFLVQLQSLITIIGVFVIFLIHVDVSQMHSMQ